MFRKISKRIQDFFFEIQENTKRLQNILYNCYFIVVTRFRDGVLVALLWFEVKVAVVVTVESRRELFERIHNLVLELLC